MKYNPDKHHRRSIRLRGYDYAQAGSYFVTVCVRDRECLFGDVVDGEMRLNDAGRIVRDTWDALSNHYSGLQIDQSVIMPNHIHGILLLTECAVGAIHKSPLPSSVSRRRMTISLVIGRFKMVAAKQINVQRAMPGLPVWQRNYYEHVIRNDDSLGRIRQYIDDNPLRWPFDPENPAATQPDSLEEWV